MWINEAFSAVRSGRVDSRFRSCPHSGGISRIFVKQWRSDLQTVPGGGNGSSVCAVHAHDHPSGEPGEGYAPAAQPPILRNHLLPGVRRCRVSRRLQPVPAGARGYHPHTSRCQPHAHHSGGDDLQLHPGYSLGQSGSDAGRTQSRSGNAGASLAHASAACHRYPVGTDRGLVRPGRSGKPGAGHRLAQCHYWLHHSHYEHPAQDLPGCSHQPAPGGKNRTGGSGPELYGIPHGGKDLRRPDCEQFSRQ